MSSQESTTPAYNEEVVSAFLDRQVVKPESLADHLGVATDLISFASIGLKVFSDEQAEKIAIVHGYSPYAVYSETPPEFPKALVDFRKAEPSKASLTVKGLRSISSVRSYLHTAASIGATPPALPEISTDPEKAAEQFRKLLGINDTTQLQLGGRSELFRFIRAKIEALRIFVFSVTADFDDFRGLAINEQGLWAICFNSADRNAGARSFTLLHELAHVALGVAGISDPQRVLNDTERFCNKVAAFALAPGRLIEALAPKNPHPISKFSKFIGYFANKLGTSKHMVAIRLIEVGLASRQQLEAWTSNFLDSHGFEPPDGGGAPDEPVPEGIKKIAKFGTYLPLLLSDAIDRGVIRKSEIQSRIGIRSKYIEGTIGAARERTQLYLEG